MKTTHRFSLSKKGKHSCPECSQKTFVLYIDNNTGEPLDSTVGKCDRANRCDHHYTPKEYFADNPNESQNAPMPTVRASTQVRTEVKPSYIEADAVNETLNDYGNNNLVLFLRNLVGEETADDVAGKYFVGTTQEGATIFWLIDHEGNVRGGKVIEYNKKGCRKKDAIPQVQWMHKVLELEDFNMVQCLFGEHLLNLDGNESMPVAIVESEKTALITSVYLSDFIWLAVGGSEGLNTEKLRVLRGRDVILFPDAGTFDKWKKKAEELKSFCKIAVSDWLERIVYDHELTKGVDIADFLVKFPPPKS